MSRAFASLALFCLPLFILAQQPAPKEKPVRELVKEDVRAAWEKAGAKVGGTQLSGAWRSPWFQQAADAAGPPVFWFPTPKGVNFAALPDPGTPFGVYVDNIDAAALDKMAKHKNLHTLLTTEGEWTAAKTKQLAALTGLRTLKVATRDNRKGVVDAVGKLKELETLEIDFSSANPAAVPLTPLAGLKKLRHLKLGYLTHSADVTKPLAGLTDLATLQVMCVLTDADVKHLAGLKKLTALDLGPSTKLTGESLKVIGEFQELEWLILRHAKFQDADLKHLAGLSKLDTLIVSSTPVTDAGLVHLKELPKLRRVDLSYTKVTDAGLATLAELPNLEFVELFGLKLSDEAVKKLEQSRPKLQVRRDMK